MKWNYFKFYVLLQDNLRPHIMNMSLLYYLYIFRNLYIVAFEPIFFMYIFSITFTKF